MKIEWNKVTWYSKIAAIILFVGVFWLGFWLGTFRAQKIYIEVPHIIRLHQAPALLVASSTPIIPPSKISPKAECFVGGCSGQICSENADMISTCEYREAYACYKTARCERQASGVCGWTPTKELDACLGGGSTR